MTGKIHSIETMGLVDGPGVRCVVFFQGCSLRCIYCHNPDTWDYSGGQGIGASRLLQKVLRYKPYFNQNGGITCSGGEPLMQPEFLIEFLKLCKKQGIHTAIDTSGCGKGNYAEILKYTDLVLLDLKHVENQGYQEMTGKELSKFNSFFQVLKKSNVKVWIRHVVIPGFTDSREHLQKLQAKVRTFPNVEKVELLPYHTLGINKYEQMGLRYKLAGVQPMDKQVVDKLAKEYFGENVINR